MAYDRRYEPFSEDEARAKFAYFRRAEATIDAGPGEYEPAQIQGRKDVTACGTHSGYVKHIKLKTEPWRSCMDARAHYQREYRWRRQNKQAA